MTTDIQKSYKEIFETYLNFNRHHRAPKGMIETKVEFL